jgi:hypothetical protein
MCSLSNIIAGMSKVNLEDMSINELAQLVKGLQAKKDVTPEDLEMISRATEVFIEKMETAEYIDVADPGLPVVMGGPLPGPHGSG